MSGLKNNHNSVVPFQFEYLKKVMKNDAYRYRAQKLKIDYTPKIPAEIALQLTYKCNLRCKSCMQWSGSGFLRTNSGAEPVDLDIDIIQKILHETREERSSLHLWGGEPLYHCEWEKVSFLLENDKRKIVLNTNGILIEEKIEPLLKAGVDIHVVISLDGNRESNNSIRGKGTYEKIIRGIYLINKARKENWFKGQIIINTVLNEYLIPFLSDYVVQINSMKVDMLVLNYPWYISDSGKAFMDKYFVENYAWLIKPNNNNIPSWHSFRFSFPDSLFPVLKKQLKQIKDKELSIKLRLQPHIDPEKITGVLTGSHTSGLFKNTCCLGTYNRISVCANGDVSACPDFPEFVMGNLYNESLPGIWNGDNYKRTRELRNNGEWPLPICFKCSLFSFNRI